MTLDDADDGAPGGVPEYLATERRSATGRGPVRAARQQLGSGPSRIADEVARSHKDDTIRSSASYNDADDGISDVSPDVAALLQSQLQATGRSASESAAFNGKEAPVSGKGRSRGGRPAPKGAAKPAAKSAAKPAGRVAAKPAAKVAAKPGAKPSPSQDCACAAPVVNVSMRTSVLDPCVVIGIRPESPSARTTFTQSAQEWHGPELCT